MGRPKKIIDNVEVDIMDENIEVIETVDSAIGDLSDSLVIDGDVRVLNTIISEIDVEATEMSAEIVEAVEEAITDDVVIETDVEAVSIPVDTATDSSYYQLLYKDKDNYPWTHTEKIVATEAEAQLWCTRGPEQREIRTYIPLVKISVV